MSIIERRDVVLEDRVYIEFPAGTDVFAALKIVWAEAHCQNKLVETCFNGVAVVMDSRPKDQRGAR